MEHYFYYISFGVQFQSFTWDYFKTKAVEIHPTKKARLLILEPGF
jgi:hypothetical protein